MKKGLPILLRLLAVATILAAPWLPAFERADESRSVVLVVDRSASVPRADLALADQLARQFEIDDPGVQLGLVEVDAHARVVRWPGATASRWTSVSIANGTDLAAGVQLGAAILPESGHRRLLILSDGRVTTEGVEDALARAREAGIRVDVIALAADRPDAPRFTEVGPVHPRITQGEPLEAIADLEGPPGETVDIAWRRDGTWQASTSVTFDEEGRARAELSDPEPEAGVHVYEAILAQGRTGSDGRGPRERFFATVSGRPRILLVTLLEEDTPTLLMSALEGVGQLDRHALERGPVPSEAIRRADLVVLADLPLERAGTAGGILSGLDESTQRELLEYVSEDGGGLIVGGGAFGFGPNWSDQPITRLLPVGIADAGEIEDPPVAMAMMLDASGSMGLEAGGYTKIRLAVEGCLAAASTLRDEDRVAIAAVEDRTRWVQPLAVTPELDRARVRTLRAGGGGIFVYTGLRDAYRLLGEAPEPIRHVVLFSDTHDSEEQYDGCICCPRCLSTGGRWAVDLAREARGAGITTTVLGIGSADGPDVSFLQQLAAAGGGRYYLTEDGTDLSHIFVTETRAVARSNLREELVNPARADASPLLEGIDELPPIGGFVQTDARETSHVALTVADGHPLLASWRYGVGNVVAFTSDLGGRWSRQWNDWEQAPQLFRQIVRSSLRRSSSRMDLQASLRDGMVDAELTVADGSDFKPADLELAGVSGFGDLTPLSPRVERLGPGRYRVRAESLGRPAALIRVRDEHQRVLAEVSVQDHTFSEFSGSGADTRALREMARHGGGALLADPAAALVPAADPTPRREPAWPWALTLAGLLVVLDLFARRLSRATRRVAIPGLCERAPAPEMPASNSAPEGTLAASSLTG